MPTLFEDRTIGADPDRVKLVLGNEEVLIAESYAVHCGILTQPASWSMRIGWSKTSAALLKRYPPNTPFQLFIGDNLQQTGNLDSPGVEESSGATTFTVRGRDSLAPLHDDLVNAERSFDTEKYIDLVQKQLQEVGLGDRVIVASNRANRIVKAGVPIIELEPVKTVAEIRLEAGGVSSGPGAIKHVQVQARLGERRFEFLMRYLSMGGLFLWAAADGGFVLSEPNSKQEVAASIIRKVTGQTRNDVTVKSAMFSNSTEHRYRRYAVYGRGVGRKGGHLKALGLFEDTEMADWGFVKTKTIRSTTIRTEEQAQFVARKMAAEDRRNGYQLKYVVSGHTVPTNGTQRMVWTPDTVIRVRDELLNINDDMYLESCEYRRSPHTETELTLMRRQDLVFGPNEFE